MWTLFGIDCLFEARITNWFRFFRTGKLNCDGMNEFRVETAQPGLRLFRAPRSLPGHLIRNGVTTRDVMRQAIVQCNCGLKQDEIGDLLVAVQ
ncbi:hypothetical protein BV898_18017 [Hypsibius exemplaris]|uniref:Uncharacterized protein n=1 Tax=Hypsibius exemplaris TaxID=2072580 RepID=A0A9X6NJ12_HYPEX|nr:hypothetical protein BV898_18017 [Hypsibius exemplaris]